MNNAIDLFDLFAIFVRVTAYMHNCVISLEDQGVGKSFHQEILRTEDVSRKERSYTGRQDLVEETQGA